MLGLVLAHQGGSDEILFVAVPVGLFSLALFVANRRARAQLDSTRAVDSERAGVMEEPGRLGSDSLDRRPD